MLDVISEISPFPMLSVVSLNVVLLNIVVSNGTQYHVVMLSVISTECHHEAPYAELFQFFFIIMTL